MKFVIPLFFMILVVYADGKIASASQRAWTNKFIYATYGNFTTTANYAMADRVAEASDHGVNNCQEKVGGVIGYMNTTGGDADCRARGFGYTSGDTTKFNATDPPLDPDMFFLNDEPDAEEANMERTFLRHGLEAALRPQSHGHPRHARNRER